MWRMRRRWRNFSPRHPQVSWVSYAGLPSNPFNALAKKYLPKGAGAVFTFGVKGGYEAGITAGGIRAPVLASRQCRATPAA